MLTPRSTLTRRVLAALDATRERTAGRVEVLARPAAAGFVEVSVIDEGQGLSAEQAQQAFQPFVTTKAAGTGLGLTIVKKLVEQHGGEVSLVPREDRPGAIARFTLRAAPA